MINDRPDRSGYQGYLLGVEGNNGSPYGMGISFPTVPEDGDYFLRTDFSPKRLFRYDGNRWIKLQDGVRVDLSNFIKSLDFMIIDSLDSLVLKFDSFAFFIIGCFKVLVKVIPLSYCCIELCGLQLLLH